MKEEEEEAKEIKPEAFESQSFFALILFRFFLVIVAVVAVVVVVVVKPGCFTSILIVEPKHFLSVAFLFQQQRPNYHRLGCG